MWMVDPKIMCREHLLGEHVETHMFVGTIDRGKSIEGYLRNGLVELHNLYERHAELVDEMLQRGYNHCSEVDEKWKCVAQVGVINREKSLRELLNRCSKCKSRHLKIKTKDSNT